jgi:hypothetical protein
MAFFRGPNVVTDGLVLALDAANPISYVSGSTTWNDLSGNGFNGTLVATPSYSLANNGNIVFNGTSNYVTFNNLTTPTLGLTSSNGASISCWLKLNARSIYNGVVAIYTTGNSEAFGWDLANNNNIRIWKNSNVRDTAISIVPYSNIWTHYVFVSNSTNVIFYINGYQTYTTSITGNIVDNGTLTFGANWDGTFQGNSSTLQIHNRALSSSEIQQNYNALKSRFNLN